MANNENLIPIPGRLYSVATEGHVAGADQIIDDETGLTLDKVAGGALEEKEYTSGSNNGMGRVVLRKNLVNGVNTLTQTMINKSNTIYVIQYDFTLGEDITIPDNCVLEFDGGSIVNHIIKLPSSSRIINKSSLAIFDNCKTQGLSTPVNNPYDFDLYSIDQAAYSSWFKNTSDFDLFTSLSIFDEVYFEKDLTFNYVGFMSMFLRNRKDLKIHGNGHTITTYHENSLQGSGRLFGYRVPEGSSFITGCEGATMFFDNISIVSKFVNNEEPELVWDREDWTKTNYVWCTPIVAEGGASIVLESVNLDVYGKGLDCAGLTTYNQSVNNKLIIKDCDIKYEYFCIEGVSNNVYAVNSKFIDGKGRSGLVLSGFVSSTHDIVFCDCTIDSGMELSGPGHLTLRGCVLREGCGYGSLSAVYRTENLLNVTIDSCRTNLPWDGEKHGQNWNVDRYEIYNSVFTMYGDTNTDPSLHYLYNAISPFDYSVKHLVIANCYIEYKWNVLYITNFNLVEDIIISNCVIKNSEGVNKLEMYVGDQANANIFVQKTTVKGVDLDEFSIRTDGGRVMDVSHLQGTSIPFISGAYSTIGRNKTKEICFFTNVMGATHEHAKYMDKLIVYDGNKYLDAFGNNFTAKRYGETSDRPTWDLVKKGYCFFDTSLSPARPIWWNGDYWVDATGTQV